MLGRTGIRVSEVGVEARYDWMRYFCCELAQLFELGDIFDLERISFPLTFCLRNPTLANLADGEPSP